MSLRRALLAALVPLALAAGCGGPGHVQYDNDHCLIDGQPATLSEVEARQAAVAARIQARQPWFAVVTIVVVLVAGASNFEKIMVLLRARKKEGAKPLGERIRDALDRQRESPLRFGAIVGSTLGLLAVAAGFYIYLDVDKRASERALGMLQFCHLALRTSEEQGVLTEQKKNLMAIQSTAGDIRSLVDKLPPEEKQKAREIVAQMQSALEKQGKIVGDYLTRSDEQSKELKEHTAFVEKGIMSLSTDLTALKSLPLALKEIGDGVKRVDGKVGADEARAEALQQQLAAVDKKVEQLLARPACEPPKPVVAVVAPGKTGKEHDALVDKGEKPDKLVRPDKLDKADKTDKPDKTTKAVAQKPAGDLGAAP